MKETPYTREFESAQRASVVDDNGRALTEFKKTLTPRYAVVWSHILIGYVAVLAAAGFFAMSRFEGSLISQLIFVAAGGLWIGYWLAYLLLFFHEAAHFLIAPSKWWNDLLANTFIGSLVGLNIKSYRVTHFDHHRHHGTTMDTENTYFDPLNIQFLVESLFGIKAARVLLSRQKHTAQKKASTLGIMTLIGAALNGAIVLGSLATGHWHLAATWTIGVLVFVPFFGAVRQVLEHRDTEALSTTDYHTVDHGAYNRMFGDGPIASTLGGAGFNRHLLHHGEPQISYTRLKELETFILHTPLKEPLAQSNTTYLETFIALLRAR
jgi:fatty acid desaturase